MKEVSNEATERTISGEQLKSMRLMNTAQAAEYLGISPGTLRCWCSMHKHIPFVKIGRAVRYDRFELDKFIKENTIWQN